MNAPARRDAVGALLRQHGWVLVEGGTALATKVYSTVVGPKEAQVYLSRSRDDDPNQTLSGQYYSEGRNIMAVGVLLPKVAAAADVERLVGQFAREADAAVDASYARAIWLRDQREAVGLPRWA